jgi:hypothetical protein
MRTLQTSIFAFSLAVLTLAGLSGKCESAPYDVASLDTINHQPSTSDSSDPQDSQDKPPTAPDTAVTTSRDTYRLRVENVQYGRIEVSIDSGETFILLGRVTKPAILPAPDKSAKQPGVIVRSGGEGICMAIAVGQVIKLLPAPEPNSRAKPPDCAAITDIKPRTSIFGEFAPPAGTPALQQTGRAQWRPYQDGMAPTEETVFAFIVVLPSVHGSTEPPAQPDATLLAKLAEARKKLAALSEQYISGAIARARDAGRSIVSGTLTINAKLPPDEPEPITAVSFYVDGDNVSAQNTFPAVYGWDTTRVPNGEHVVEIRGLSKFNTIITKVRTLVVVNNEKP